MPRSSSPNAAVSSAREQWIQSVAAVNAADQKLAALLGFTGIIISLIFGLHPPVASRLALWVARMSFIVAVLLAVYGLYFGQPSFGPDPTVRPTVLAWRDAWAVNLAVAETKVTVFRHASFTLLIGFAALILAIG